jgi:hypothetical protein
MEAKPPHVELGKDFNGYERRVMDTTSSFKLNETMNVQLYNETAFNVDSVQVRVYRGTLQSHEDLQFTQSIAVNPKSQDLVIRGTQNKPLSARGFLRSSKTGSYYLEFRDGPRVIAGKELTLHSAKD